MSTTPTPTPVPSIADAITAVEQAGTNYGTAVTQTMNDQTAAAAAQAKADAAAAVVTSDQAAQSTAAGNYTVALQGLVNAAQAQIAALAPPAPPAGN